MKTSALRRRILLSGLSLGLFLSAGFQSSVFAADRLDDIKARGTFKVAVEGTYPPFNFQDEKGRLAGFEIDLSEALAKQMGVKAVFLPTKWDGILAALETGRVDAVINQVTITEERKSRYDFSTPYTITGVQAMTLKGKDGAITQASDLAGKKVGVGLGTTYEKWLREHVPQTIIKTYDDEPTKYQDLRVGRIDAILVDRLAALDLSNKTDGNLVAAGEAFSRQESAITLRKGNPELLAAINAALAQLQADGTLAALSQKWFKVDVTK